MPREVQVRDDGLFLAVAVKQRPKPRPLVFTVGLLKDGKYYNQADHDDYDSAIEDIKVLFQDNGPKVRFPSVKGLRKACKDFAKNPDDEGFSYNIDCPDGAVATIVVRCVV